MSFSNADVARIAQLARIELSPSETARVAGELDRIFALIETMRALDTEGIEPLTTPLAAVHAFPLRMRDDVVTEADHRADYQRPAPSVEDGLYLVPKVIE